jgi:hypothetical protein
MEGTVASARVRLAGSGRNHTVRLAEAGGDIIAVDVCAQLETTPVATARLRLRTHASGKRDVAKASATAARRSPAASTSTRARRRASTTSTSDPREQG